MSSDVVVITGAASGIGRALAQKLQKQPYRLVLADINTAGLTATFGTDTATQLIRPLDVTSVDSWRNLLAETRQQFGRIDYLFNIAGVILPGRIHETPLENIDYHVDVNVKGVLIGMRLASELMVAQGSGHIINIASQAGIAPVPGITLYTASKFAVRGASLAAAADLQDKGVFVTVVCPGLVDTPMLDLQLGYEEASIPFSNGPALRPEQLADKLVNVMRKRPLEVVLPRGFLARVAGSFPRVAMWLRGVMSKRGRVAMQAIDKKRG